MAAPRPRQWTLFTNHAAVLLHLLKHPQATIRSIADELGLAERTVVNVLADLRADGHLLVEKVGRQNTYFVNPNAEMRRPEHSGQQVREFLSEVVKELEHAREILEQYASQPDRQRALSAAAEAGH